MTKRAKKTVWHKRREKFIPSSLIQSHQTKLHEQSEPSSQAKLSRRKAFLSDLSAQIKKALGPKA